MAVPRGSQSRLSTPISLIAVHTSEGARTAYDLQSYLDGKGVEASYHVLVDDEDTIRYLPDQVACWAMLSGNPRALQVCLAGFAAWTRAEWLSHGNMLKRGAAVVRAWCIQHDIPAKKLTPTQVGSDWWGVCGHWDWTLGKRDGTHTDPGPNFPWDVFIALVNGSTQRKASNHMQELPSTPMPANPLSDPKTWTQRNYDVFFDMAGGWEGDCAVAFGAQDWPTGRTDDARGYLQIASWITADRKLVPVNPVFVAGKGAAILAQNPTAPYTAPKGAVGISLNYSAPAGAGLAIGRSA